MTIFTITNFVNTNPRFSINYFDIVLLFTSHHQLQINDRRTDIQVCRHYNFGRVDVNTKMFTKTMMTDKE